MNECERSLNVWFAMMTNGGGDSIEIRIAIAHILTCESPNCQQLAGLIVDAIKAYFQGMHQWSHRSGG